MNDISDDDADETLAWTPEGATRLTAAAEAVQHAIAAHARAIVAADGDREVVFRASEELLTVLVAYGSAQGDLTGYGFPLLALEQFVEDDEDEDEDDPLAWPTTAVSVTQRHDYEVVDTDAVLAAGRAAYLVAHPDDTEADASSDVTHLGRALYQLAHADGWDSLHDVPGLDPIGGVVAVVRQDTPLGPDPDEWTSAVASNADADDILYTQDDVYRH